MTTYESTEMPACNLTKTINNKWLQQSSNKMTCMYKAMVDDLISVFMHITKYMSWLKEGSNGKGPNLASLKLKVATRCCPAPFHEESSKHQGHKGDPGVMPGTCGTIGEKAQVILVWVKAPGVGNASHP
jgi:hypothetical protein